MQSMYLAVITNEDHAMRGKRADRAAFRTRDAVCRSDDSDSRTFARVDAGSRLGLYNGAVA
uniref:Uncharacterized protein n=1 Tax=Anopheles dirus TaxID=7168 RepID=A0A182NYQ6_9DIPT